MTEVSITHSRKLRTTLIDVDGVRLQRVRHYSITQEPQHHPVSEIIQDDENGAEFSRTFVPDILVLRCLPS